MLNRDYIVRKMTSRDLDKIMAIEVEAFSLPWSRESYASELENRYATYVVADYDGEIAGYGGIWVVVDEAHITNVAVNLKYRGQGISHNLLASLENVARLKRAIHIFLEVRVSNQNALSLYEGHGFMAAGIRKQYYSDNDEDALVMVKMLQ